MIENLRNELDAAIKGGQQKNVTNIRGRLIETYKKEIKELEKKKDLTEDEQKTLSNLKEELQKEISEHKIQLDARYSNEVIREETSFAKIVELPKNVGTAIQRVKACAQELKYATTTKQKIFKGLELMKDVGLVAATPVIYIGKLALKHWYVPVAALSVLKATDSDLINNIPKSEKISGIFDKLDEIRNSPVIKPIYDGFDKVTDKGIDLIKDKIWNESDDVALNDYDSTSFSRSRA